MRSLKACTNLNRTLHGPGIAYLVPLWLGDMSAFLKGVPEQVARPGFALSRANAHEGFLSRHSLGVQPIWATSVRCRRSHFVKQAC